MKKLILLAAASLLVTAIDAQPWMQGRENQRVNLKEVIAAYQQSASSRDADEEEEAREAAEHGGAVREGKDYQFDRWRWYMEQHTDEQGYLVSPLKNFREWRAYQDRISRIKTASKTTGTIANWTFMGPSSSPGGYNGIGRIQAVAFHPTDSNTFWVATGGGGAWKTTNNGVTWTAMTDNLPVLGVSDVAYNPKNPNTIYLCTGDKDAGDSYSIGVLKSTNGGATWDTTGLQWTEQQTREVNAILVNPLDTNSLVLATSLGIYRSFDGGAHWTTIPVQTGNFKQLAYRPNDTSVVYAAGRNINIYRSGDGGTTWNQVTNISGTARMALAVTPANPNLVKAVVANGSYGLEGIYSSSDAGLTFTKIFSDTGCTRNILNGSLTLSASTCGGQGWYDLCMAISPVDSNKIIVGGVNSWTSANGGKNWQIANQWYGGLPGIKTVHADKHFLAYQPTRPGVLFEGNDGGIYKTANPNSTIWNDLTNGLGITQFYRNAVSNKVAFAIGGAQDNGSKRINAAGAATELTGGDGMNCEIDPFVGSVYYTATQYGSINLTTNNGVNFTNISNNIPGQPTGDWITPYSLHPTIPDVIIAGYDKVYMTLDKGSSWSAISPSFGSGNLIKRVALSISDPSTIYIMVSNSIRYTYDFGATWAALPVPYLNTTISDIAVDPVNNKHIWVTFSGYGVFKTAEFDGVAGWTNHSNLLPNVPVNCVAIDSANGTRYIGTDLGVFYLTTTMIDWALYNTNLPAATVQDLGINYATGEIWAATYGRGMWKSPKYDPPVIAPSGISLIPLAADVITIAPNPNDGHFTIRTANSALQGQQVVVRILDVSGRTAWKGAGAFDAAGNLEIHAEGVARGTYITEVTSTRGMMARTKMVVF